MDVDHIHELNRSELYFERELMPTSETDKVPSQEWMEPEASCGDGQVPAEDWFRDAEFSMDDAVVPDDTDGPGFLEFISQRMKSVLHRDKYELESVKTTPTVNLLVKNPEHDWALLWWHDQKLMTNSPDKCRSQFVWVDRGDYVVELMTLGHLYLSVDCDQKLPKPKFTLQTGPGPKIALDFHVITPDPLYNPSNKHIKFWNPVDRQQYYWMTNDDHITVTKATSGLIPSTFQVVPVKGC